LPGTGRNARRVAAVVAFATVFTVGISVMNPNDDAAMAVTPPMLSTETAPTGAGASEELRGIAAAIEGVPDDVGVGTTTVIDTQSWSLFTRVDDQQVTSEVVPVDTVLTIAAEGTRRIDTTYTYAGETEQQTDTEPGEPVQPLPTDLATLTQRLAENNAPARGPSGRFDAVVEAHLQTPAPPLARAAVLRYLAQTPGIATVGKVVDRLGREGVGFTVDDDSSGLATRYLIIVDPSTGHLLGYEEMLTGDAGKLNVETPSVIQYTLWVSASHTSAP
jgi:hypothetical protein